MLEDGDIQFIKDNREQITANRKEDVVLYKQVQTGTSPLTGDPVYGEPTATTVQGRIKTLISQSGGEGEIELENGVLVVTDDIILNLDIDIDITGVTEIERVLTGERYVIKAKDVKGLGEPNRHFILLELIK